MTLAIRYSICSNLPHFSLRWHDILLLCSVMMVSEYRAIFCMQSHDNKIMVEMGLSPLLYVHLWYCLAIHPVGVVGLHPHIELYDKGSAVQGWQERGWMDIIYTFRPLHNTVISLSFGGVKDRTWKLSKIRDLPAGCEEKIKHSREVGSEDSAGNKAL